MESMVLNKERSVDELFASVMDNTPEASGILMQMFYEDSGVRNIEFCDRMQIRGVKLQKLFMECCSGDYNAFRRTLVMIKTGVFSAEEVERNLSLARSIPFATKEVKISGMPSFEGIYEPEDRQWAEFCYMNRMYFLQRYDTALRDQEGHIRQLEA